jgi:lipopolysaccharide heptosyltransferase II
MRPGFEARLAKSGRRYAKRQVQAVIRLGLTVAGRLTTMRRRQLPALRPGDRRVRRILVIRTDLIGDLVLSLPAVHALRRGYPDAQVDVIALPSSAGVLAGESDIARIFTYDPNVWRRPSALLTPRNWAQARELVATLRARRYDLCLSVAGDWASVLAWCSGARRRVGYSGEAYPGLLTDPVPGGRYAVRQHEVQYVRTLARMAGGIIADDEVPRLRVAVPAATRVSNMLDALGILEERPIVILHPGARNGAAKRWPTRHWAELAELLVHQLRATVILTGAPSDAALAGTIMTAARAPVHDLTGKTSLPELVALLGHSELVVSGDSGPLHIAGALGIPVVGIFGPTDPQISGPLGRNARVVRRALWCAPCYDASATADCRFHNPICMKTLSARTVLAAVAQQLAKARQDLAPSDLRRSQEAPAASIPAPTYQPY